MESEFKETEVIINEKNAPIRFHLVLCPTGNG